MSEKSPWDTDSAIFTDYEGQVVDAFFAPGQQGGNWQLNLKMQTDSPDYPEWVERYSVGGDWVSGDAGETVQHRSASRFKSNSGYGEFIKAARNVICAGVDEDKQAEYLTQIIGDDPRKAKIWVGCKFAMEASVTKFKNRQTGEEVEFSKNLPTKFFGKEEVAGSGNGSTPAPTQTATGTSILSAGNQALAKMYASQLDHGAWMDKMVEILANEDLIGKPEGDTFLVDISDPSKLYSQLRA